MGVPIFPSCSYIVVVAPDSGLRDFLVKACGAYPIRVIFCPHLADFETKLGMLKRVTGLIVFANNLKAPDVARISERAKSRRIPMRLSSESAAESPEKLAFKLIEDLLSTHIPKGLEPALTMACNRIFPGFFSDLGTFASSGSTIPPSGDFDRQVVYYVVGKDLIGYCSAKAKITALKSPSPTNSAPDILEATNQCIGLIVQNLVKIGI
jgi:hypothetical protein